MVYRFVHRPIAALYPASCLLCGGKGHEDLDICRGCLLALPRIEHACPHCAIPLPPTAIGVCGSCQRWPPTYERARIPYHYQQPVDYLIQRLKFSGQLNHSRLLAALLGRYLVDSPMPQCLIPVPLHAKRIRARGFNQALEIARHLGRLLRIPVEHRKALRVRHTNPQMELPAKARHRNIRQAFQVHGVAKLQRVAIIDDVVTTGSTVEELARTLRQAGVDDIQVWGCARAG